MDGGACAGGVAAYSIAESIPTLQTTAAYAHPQGARGRWARLHHQLRAQSPAPCFEFRVCIITPDICKPRVWISDFFLYILFEYRHINIHTYIHIYIHICVCVYIYMHVCMTVCIYMYVNIYISRSIALPTLSAQRAISLCGLKVEPRGQTMLALMNKDIYICVYTHTYIYTYIYTYVCVHITTTIFGATTVSFVVVMVMNGTYFAIPSSNPDVSACFGEHLH